MSVDKEGRKIKCRCTCKWSSKNSNSLSCTSLQDEDREKNFKYVWKVLNDWSGRKAYISSLIERKKITKRRKTSILTDSTKRNVTYKYHLIKDNMRINVCKKMFLHTLDVGERSVQSWLRELSHDNAELGEDNFEPLVNDPVTPVASSKRKRPSEDVKSRSVEEFFRSLPKMESHYCRASTQKLYLEPVWESKVALFKEYKQNFCVDNSSSASWSVFSRVMYKLNIDLYQPKKDQCETCIKHKLGTVSDEEFKIHQNKKDKSRAEKEKDKERALSNESLGVYTVDVQAVLLLPNIMSSSAYYKTKLKLHNYTIYNMKNAEVNCFLWHEANGSLESDVFASILFKFLQKEICEKKLSEIIIWSDGCAYQNRCEKVSNALLHLSNVNKVTISHKYLEVGHTQMEVDSVHSKIEKKIKGKEFYVPFDYVRSILEARTKPSKFNVVVLKYTDFLDFSNGYYTSVRPGLKKGDPIVADVCAFRYFEGYIYFKLDLEENWRALPRRPKTHTAFENLPNLYKSPIKITTRKFEDLQYLKKVINEDYHHFYDTLPHECNDEKGPCRHVVLVK